MRKFSSYGPVNTKLHFYAPRTALIDRGYTRLIGESLDEGGHYITVWGPRQTGKSWLMNQILWKLQEHGQFHALKINLEHLKMTEDTDRIVRAIANEIIEELNLSDVSVNTLDEFHNLFLKDVLGIPLILILDEFDALAEDAISGMVGVFRNIFNHRQTDRSLPRKKKYLLHGLALIGVRSVLGIENLRGSPFNIQRSLHIPNLTFEETEGMFRWYEKESGQKVNQKVVELLYNETRGQPGITCWLGELLTEGFDGYETTPGQPLGTDNFEDIYAAAIYVLPNNNILNIISKARQEPYKNLVFEVFRTDKKIRFRYDDPAIAFLYMNGVIDLEKSGQRDAYVRFSCPFVQKRLFNYFAGELFGYVGKIHEPFEDLSDTFTKEGLNIRNLICRHQDHLKKNREWLLKDAPRRKDLRVFEAVYHFNLYRYLCDFLEMKKARVRPEFPTGNGKIDLLIEYRGKMYGIEVKSYTDESGYHEALDQAADYGKKLGLPEIALVFFVEYVDADNRKKYEKDYQDKETGVKVMPVFVETGN